MKVYTAMNFAEQIQRELAPFCIPGRCEIAGSIRRGRPEVNDIDMVLLPRPGQLAALKARCKSRCRVIRDGEKNFTIAMLMGDRSEFQIDIFFAHAGTEDLLAPQPSNFGSVLLCRTGSKEHNVMLCELAKSRDMKWATYDGLLAGGEWRRIEPGAEEEYVGGKIIASETEEQIFSALGLKWVPPALREVGVTHTEKCEICGQAYDPAQLDQVLFHNTDHQPRIATGIIGQRVHDASQPASPTEIRQ
jgi:DNA polymerase/3'-5' exonuclease PolX